MENKRIDFKSLMPKIRKHMPERLCVPGIAGVVAITCLAVRSKHKRRSNNWLKMHGKPMRRKIKRRLRGLA